MFISPFQKHRGNPEQGAVSEATWGCGSHAPSESTRSADVQLKTGVQRSSVGRSGGQGTGQQAGNNGREFATLIIVVDDWLLYFASVSIITALNFHYHHLPFYELFLPGMFPIVLNLHIPQ